LQAGTSHFLGQNFSKSCGIQFRNVAGEQEYGWTTSWGATTRLIGAMIMAHSDDDGLVLPPRIASAHLAIIPIIHSEEARAKILSYCDELSSRLKKVHYHGQPLRVIVDVRDMRGGEKSWSWIKKGIPLRLEVGLREMEAGQLQVARRDKPHKEMTPFAEEGIVHLLEEIQANLLAKATAFRDQHTVEIRDEKTFKEFFTSKGDEIHGGFALCHFSEDAQIEAKLKDEFNVTVRCIPLHLPQKPGKCIFTGKAGSTQVIFAKAY
ncbi:MAG: proline--tRNA ligase, partial [Verrucomicrobiota bacterium]|nr:proline--tRNA ligase [Verrucomicrobiota bacterium]